MEPLEDPTLPDFGGDRFTAEIVRRPRGGASIFGWALALAFAVTAGVLANLLIDARSEIAALQADAAATESGPEGQAPGEIVVHAGSRRSASVTHGEAPGEIVIEAMSEDVAFRALLKASELADLQRRIAEAEHALRQKKVLLERSGNALRRERERRYGLQRQLDAGQKETDRLGRVVEELQRELDFIQRTKDRGAPPASAR